MATMAMSRTATMMAASGSGWRNKQPTNAQGGGGFYIML
jgi:hypothetical protein